METASVQKNPYYQDIWIKGRVTIKGSRECEMRYKMILNVLLCLTGPEFTVIDFGAHSGYFTNRIAYDFPRATCIAIDTPNEILLPYTIEMNALPNVQLIQKRFNVQDLHNLYSELQGDLTLVMSVIHHFHEEWQDALEALRKLSTYTLVECYPPDKSNGRDQEYYYDIYQYMLDEGGLQVKHPGNGDRPMFILSDQTFRFPVHLLEG